MALQHRHKVGAAMASPGFTFDAHERIAFCFTCVARSLTPEQEPAAIVLRETFDLSYREAADMIGVSESALRHHLEASREHMEAAYEGLCSPVNKNGVC